MQATIIAVGSELLVGQITNRNAAWISARLFADGIGTRRHVTVDDVEDEIVAALAAAEAAGALIFVTGGLGPTSDDLTRNAVARWAGQELVWDEPSWTRIEAFFATLARATPPSNRQQCYFPVGAAVLENAAGTANAFSLTVRGKRVWVLPGPPREVEAVWTAHVAAQLTALVPLGERSVHKMWRTIGRGESHLAEQIEELIKGKGVEVAYRASPPFVETKLRFPAKDRDKHGKLCGIVEDALRPWLFEVDDEDSARSLLAFLNGRKGPTRLLDTATRGNLVEMLSPLWRAGGKSDLVIETAWGNGGRARPAPGELVLSVGPGRSPDSWLAAAATASGDVEAEFPNAFKGEANRARNDKAIAFLVLKQWPALAAQVE